MLICRRGQWNMRMTVEEVFAMMSVKWDFKAQRHQARTEGRAGQPPAPAATVACDELWTYRGVRRGGRRESRWIWAAAVAEKDGRRWVDLAVDDRSENTFLRLYDRLPEAAVYCSDRYAVYWWFPQDRHCAGKGGAVNWNEGLHSVLRSKLNRLMRRTKGYTKSVEMLVYSLALVCGRQEAKPNICAHQ